MDGDVVHLQSRNPGDLSFAVFPDLGKVRTMDGQAVTGSSEGIFVSYTATAPRKCDVVVQLDKITEAALAPPLRYSSDGMLVSPTNEDFDGAAAWEIVLPQVSFDSIEDVFLRIDYVGDIARLYLDGRLIADNFYNGTTWEIGLRRFLPDVLGSALELKIMPIREDAPVYLPTGARPSFDNSPEIVDLVSVEALPLYSVSVTATTAPPRR